MSQWLGDWLGVDGAGVCGDAEPGWVGLAVVNDDVGDGTVDH